MPKPLTVKAIAPFRIWLRHDDGAEGIVVLSDLDGRAVFRSWEDRDSFSAVRLSAHGAIEWGSDTDLCPDAMYMRLTGKSAEEDFPAIRSVRANA